MVHWLKKYWKWIALGFGLVLLSVAISFLPVGQWVKSFTAWVRHLGVAGAFVFVGVYALATVLFLPGAIFTIAAGLVYGIAGGTAVALITGATIGALARFSDRAVICCVNGSKFLRKRTRSLPRSTKRSGNRAGKSSAFSG